MTYMVIHKHTIVFILALTISLCSSQTVHAQTPVPESKLPTVIQPSPTAASLGKYGDIPVGYHTGVVNVDIPIYQLKEGPITVPISLGYHTSGIRVAEAASWVGLGWALNCGGVITRSVQHVPDEGPLSEHIPESSLAGSLVHSGYYKNGFILPEKLSFNSFNVNTQRWGDSTEAWAYRVYHNAAAGNVDCEPDMFFYNFGRYSGKFFFKVEKQGDGSFKRTPVFIPKADVKVDVQFATATIPGRYVSTFDTRTTFISFVITTPDGFKYYFGQTDSATLYATEYSGTETFTSSSHSTSDIPRFSPSSWYLTKITSPDGHQVTFEYGPDQYSFFDLAAERCWTVNDFYDLKNQQIMRTAINGGQLTKITTTNEEIIFHADTVREDLSMYENYGGNEGPQGNNQITTKRLDRIEIKRRGGQSVRLFDLRHSYFQCDDNGRLTTPIEIEQTKSLFYTDKKRLKLDAIIERSGDLSLSKPPYVFTYCETDIIGQPKNLPRRMSYQQDHWGYFNGAVLNNTLVPFPIENSPRDADRNTNIAYAQVGVLKSVKYPTGAVSNFEYESNEAIGPINMVDVNSGKNYGASAQLFSSDPKDVYTSFSVMRGFPAEGSPCYYDTLNQVQACQEYQASVSIDAGDPRPGVYTTYDLDYSLYASEIIAGIYKASDSSIMYAFHVGDLQLANSSYCNSQNCNYHNGTDYIHLGRNNINVYLPPGDYYVKASRIDGPKRNDPTKNVLYTAGISVFVPAARDPNYTPPVQNAKINVGGLRIKKITNMDGSKKILERVFNYPDSGGVLFGRPTYFYTVRLSDVDESKYGLSVFDTQLWASSSILPMQSSQGSHVGYAGVSESSPGNGYTTYFYDVSPKNFSIDDPYVQGNAYNYTSKYRTFNYPPYPAPFLLERGNLVLEEKFTENDLLVYKKENIYEIENYEQVGHASKVEYIYGRSVPQTNGTIFKIADMPSYTNYPIFSGNSRLLKETETTYDLSGSNPFTVVKEYGYGSSRHLQVTESSQVRSLSENNKETSKFLYPPDYVDLDVYDNTSLPIKYLQDKNIINVPIEQIQLLQDLSTNTSTVIGGTITTFKNGTALKDKIFSLDIGSPISTNQFLPNAFQFSNRILTKFRPDSRYDSVVSFQKYDDLGNVIEMSKTGDIHTSYVWGYNKSLPIAEVKNATALQIYHTSFEDASGNVSSDAKTGSKCFSGSLHLTAPSAGTLNLTYWSKTGANQWQLQETTINGSKDIGGSGVLIDEVRIFPTGALMTTYTYDPSVGMTSSNDVNNMITYFEYDKLGRLSTIKDHESNILKTYTYRYANEN